MNTLCGVINPIPATFGSWYFAPSVTETTEFSQESYFATVRRCLAGIEGVTNVTIDLDPEENSAKVEARPLGTDPQDVYVGPHWGFAAIKFVLHVPRARQAQVEGIRRHEDIGERFAVRMGYGWQVPVCALEVLDEAATDPTSSSGLVFRYLRQEVKRSAEQLELGCIPPIFVHADFYLAAAEPGSLSDPFVLSEYCVPAYHRYTYLYDPEETPDPVGRFFFEIQSELDLYYRSQDADRQEGMIWLEVSEEIDALVDPSGEVSWLTRSTERLTRGRRIRSAATKLTRFAAQRQLVRSELARNARSQYTSGKQSFVQELVQGELDDCVAYPIEEFSRLIQMFESGRLVELQLAVVIVAAVIGAIIGAAATLAAS